MAQACHAASLAGVRYPCTINESTYLIVLKSKDVVDLKDNLHRYYGYDLDHIIQFYEPDLNDQLTSIATLNPPRDKVAPLRKLKLWSPEGGEMNG